MRLTTLGAMRAQGAWMVNIPTPTASTGINIVDSNARINAGAAELFLLVLAAAGDTAYRTSFTINTVAGQYSYALPANFYQLKQVQLQIGNAPGGDYMNLDRFTASERPYLLSATPGFSGDPFKYGLVGKAQAGNDTGSIEILPPPTSNAIVQAFYVYAPPTLVNDTDAFDGFAGFEDYAQVFYARWCCMRTQQRERAADLASELERIKDNVLASMMTRDAGQCPRVNQTRGAFQPRWSRRMGSR